MALRPGLSLGTKQRTALSPVLQHGLMLLAMPSAALRETLLEIAAQNPALKLTDPAPAPSAQGTSAYEYALSSVGQAVSLGEHLRSQVGAIRLPDSIRNAAFAITWSLDDRGYLDCPLTDIVQTVGVSVAQAEDALRVVQGCSPVGVAARSLTECLSLQLRNLGEDQATCDKALSTLDLLVQEKWSKAHASTGIPVAELKRIAALLPNLSPEPGSDFEGTDPSITPDIELTISRAGEVAVSLVTGTLPTVTLDAATLKSAQTDPEAQKFLSPFVSQAQQILSSLAFRDSALIRVGTAIVTAQIRFFLDGPSAMRPLSRKSLANTLDMHPSTVSRTIAGKYLTYAGGTVPLSAFFSSQLGEGGPSAFAIQDRIRKLIAAETSRDTLSDEAITALLRTEGVDIARRTVAKYRGRLNIAPSHLRKRRKARS